MELLKYPTEPETVEHVFNSSIQKAKTGGTLRSRQAYSTEQLSEQPWLQRKNLVSGKKLHILALFLTSSYNLKYSFIFINMLPSGL